MRRVLVVEDDEILAATLRDGFEYEGYSVMSARDGKSALDLASTKQLDVIVMDIMLPAASGLDVCNQLRKAGSTVPIIMLSARSEESDKILGLKIGADDYVTKPFSFMELMARVDALLRRSSRSVTENQTYRFGNIEIDFPRRLATRASQPLELSTREFEILTYMIQHRDEVVNRNQLLDAIWGYENFPFTRTVDVHISKLRHKIEEDPTQPRHLITVHRTGYRFVT